jgi:hypothetical protein
VLQLHNEARTAYLFQCSGDNELFAISHDLTGANIPRTTCTHGWMLRDKFPIGTEEPANRQGLSSCPNRPSEGFSPSAITYGAILAGPKGLSSRAPRHCTPADLKSATWGRRSFVVCILVCHRPAHYRNSRSNRMSPSLFSFRCRDVAKAF